MIGEFVHIEPNNSIHDGVAVRDDVVGLFPYPFNGNIANTGDRLQEIVNRTGIVLVVGEILLQDTKTLHGMPAEDALRRGSHFRSTCRWQAERVLREVERYSSAKVIGIGHSLGSVAVSGMQRYGETPPFDCVELADGFNLRQNGRYAVAGFLAYQARDKAQQLAHRMLGEDTTQSDSLPKNDWSIYTQPQVKGVFDKIRDLADIMISDEGRDGAETLAANTSLPMHVIGYSKGLSGSAEQLARFLDGLVDLRQAAALGTGRSASKPPAPLETVIMKGWHSALLNPDIAVNIRRTIDLAVAV